MTQYALLTEAKEFLYRPLPDEYPTNGYLLFEHDDRPGWTWLYQEAGEEDEFGPTFSTKSEALRDMADNWEETGGTNLPRFVGLLRGLATKFDR